MPNLICTCGIGHRTAGKLYAGRDAIINCAIHGPKQKEIRRKLFDTKKEKMDCSINGLKVATSKEETY